MMEAAAPSALVNQHHDDFPPMQAVVLQTDSGTAFVPHAFYPGMAVELPLSRGVAIAWTPCLEVAGALLVFAGGNPDQPTNESIAVTLSSDGIHALMRDLQSIIRQIDAAAK